MLRLKIIVISALLMLTWQMGLAQTSQEMVNIWEHTDVRKKVLLTPYIAEGEFREAPEHLTERKNNPCVIICPGGSYFWHDTDNEGVKVAEWLQSNGISAFVLNYRTAYVPAFMFRTRLLVRGNQYPDPQNDLQQAIRYIKEHSALYGIDTTKVGAMGFSAGGHLVMSVAEKYDSPYSRPAFVAAIYPVVSFTADCTHKRSRRGLLGEYGKNNKAKREALSLEKHVPADCPPVFLMNCVDDPIVDYRNSVLLDSALTAQGVTHKYIQYKTGGHGFGASSEKGTPECRQWKEEFLNWMEEVYGLQFTVYRLNYE